jgi:arabinogalactan oligomer/maltooligosaccharide transport system permease protein
VRRRFLAGALVASAIAATAVGFVVTSLRAESSRAASIRSATVPLSALANLVEACGGEGDDLRAAVAAFSSRTEGIGAIRVIAFDGISLEASTAPGDAGERAAPRRLEPEEKELFDRGQRLRASVQTNREEGSARKDEIEVRRLPGSRLGLAAPVEIDGEIVGFVDVETAPLPDDPGLGGFGPLLPFLLPPALVLALWIPAGRRPWVLAAATVLAVAAAAWLSIGAGATRLETDGRAIAQSVAARIASTAEAARAGAADAGLAPDSLRAPETWDADALRRPLGRIGADGTTVEEAFRASLGELLAPLRRIVGFVAVLALALSLYTGLGGAHRTWVTLNRHREAYTYVLPAMLGMVVLVFFPFLYGIVLSFTDSNLYNTNESIAEIWVGLENYVEILGDFDVADRTESGWVFDYRNFYWTLGFTIVWTVSNVTIGVTVGLALALILNTKGLALRPIYRVLLILPWAMPNYITALIWKGMFHQQFGVVNQMLQMFGFEAISWFEKPFSSFLTALATNGWLSFPFMMVISLGALQSIPADLYEAARVDGASRWQQFRAITLPSLKPSLVPAIILSVVWTFNMFNIIYLVTQGEPAGSTEILITDSYKIAFEKYQYGYAAAYSTVIFGILLVYGWFQNKITGATEAA